MLKPINVARVCAVLLVCLGNYVFADQIRLRTVAGGTTTTTTTTTGATDHPSLMMTVSGASPTVSELQTRLAGTQLTQFQAFVDIYCYTAAHGGVYDTANYGALGNYAFILVTEPVAGVNYRDCANRAGIVSKFGTLYDDAVTAITSSPCGDGCETFALISIAYHWRYTDLTSMRRQAGIDAMQAGVASDVSGGPLHHRKATGPLQYVFVGYTFECDGSEDADATTRKNLTASLVTASTGIRA